MKKLILTIGLLLTSLNVLSSESKNYVDKVTGWHAKPVDGIVYRHSRIEQKLESVKTMIYVSPQQGKDYIALTFKEGFCSETFTELNGSIKNMKVRVNDSNLVFKVSCSLDDELLNLFTYDNGESRKLSRIMLTSENIYLPELKLSMKTENDGYLKALKSLTKG